MGALKLKPAPNLRLLSEEPTGQDGPNLYWYALSNPERFLDIDGLRSREELLIDLSKIESDAIKLSFKIASSSKSSCFSLSRAAQELIERASNLSIEASDEEGDIAAKADAIRLNLQSGLGTAVGNKCGCPIGL